MKLEQIDTSTTAGKAEVMRLAAEGRKVASRAFQNNDWFANPAPSWNWQAVHYSIIAEPAVVSVYCDGGPVRVQFEAWASTGSYDLSRDQGGAYVNQCTHYAWRGWQECDAAYRASPSVRGFERAFYELADMLGISAQPCSPKEVWETQMRPDLQKLIDSEDRPEKLVPVAHAHMDPETGMHWLQWMGDPAKIPMPLYDRPPLGKPIAFIEKWAEGEDDQLAWDVEEGSCRMYIPLYAGTPFREGES